MWWNQFDLSSTGWSKLRDVTLVASMDLSRPIVWLTGLGLVAAALFGLRRSKRQPRDFSDRTLAAALVAVCVLPVGFTWSLLARDARSADGWSYTGQLLSHAMGRNECGLPDDLPVVARASPLALTSGPNEITRAIPDAYDHVPANARLPMRGVDTWGTRVAFAGMPNGDVATGRFSTPWYSVEGAREVAFWTVGRTGDPNQIVVEARAADGSVTTTPIARPGETLYWSLKPVTRLPRNAIAVRLVLQDNDDGTGGWLGATAPVAVSYKPFGATLSDHDRVWVASQVRLYAPCLDLPSIRNGYLHPLAASLVTPPSGLSEALQSEASIVETGCIALGPCAYRVHMLDPAALLVR
jgi:hypothetical protein